MLSARQIKEYCICFATWRKALHQFWRTHAESYSALCVATQHVTRTHYVYTYRTTDSVWNG